MKQLSIYLAGSIKKGDTDVKQTSYWTQVEEERIRICFGDNFQVSLINPATYPLSRADPFGNFGGDMYLVRESDFIFVDARGKKGLGVGAEMMAAKYYQIPVVCLCTHDSYYRKRFLANVCGEDLYNWTHPFIASLSDYIADTIEDAVSWMIGHVKRPAPIKNLSVVDTLIEYYIGTQTDYRNNQEKEG